MVEAAASEIPLLAVGDTAACDTEVDDKVAEFMGKRSAKIALLGDTVYETGTPEEYRDCFDPIYGSMLDRIYPAIGNHEYKYENASGQNGAGYFDYFGDRAGTAFRGWYSFNLGDYWRVIVLNSNCSYVRCDSDSRQVEWLRGALDRAGKRNVIAVTHAPRYSSGEHGNNLTVKPFFRVLYRNGADIILSGHDHSYERFRPQNAVGEYREKGVQQFVVGTGGRHLYEFGDIQRNSRARNNDTFGVLRLELRRRGYSWRFLPVVGGDYSDEGSRSLG